MNNQKPQLPERFLFDTSCLDSYVEGMNFPLAFIMSVADGEPVVGKWGYDENHPCSKFMEYLIRARAAEEEENPFMDPKEHWLNQKARLEAIFLNSKAGADEGTEIYSKSEEYLKEHNCIGAIEIYAQFAGELEKAVAYVTSRGISTSEYPFSVLLSLRDSAKKSLKYYQTRNTKGFQVIHV